MNDIPLDEEQEAADANEEEENELEQESKGKQGSVGETPITVIGESKLSNEIIEQIERESEPLAITNFFVDRPCVAICSGFGILFVLSILTIVFEFYIVDDGQSGRDYLIWSDPLVLDYTKWQAASEYAENH